MTTQEPGRVVVGYEGGPAGADAIAFGAAWCRASGDTLLVATVHPGPAPLGPGRVDAEWVAYERAEAKDLLDEAQTLVPPDVAVEVERVDASSAAHGLHDVAERTGTTLVVLGTHRSGEHRRTLPGSTAERMLTGSSGPVAIVPRGYAGTGPESLRRVTLAFIDTTDGHVAHAHGERIAVRLHASLRLVTVVPDTLVRPTTGEPSRFASAQRGDFRTALDEALARTSPAVHPVGALLEGPVADTLAEIGPEDADLLVCGSRGYGPIRRVLLGGVSTQVVRRARLPVVVVPRGEG